MSDNRKVKLNILFGIISQLLVLGINYLTKQAIFASLGAEYMGMQTVFGNVCDILTIALSGIGTVMLVRLYDVISRNDNEALSALWNYFNRVGNVITAVSAAIGALLSFVVVWLLESSFKAQYIICLFLLYLLQILIYNRFRIDYYFLLAHERLYIATLIYGAVDLVTMAAEILAVRLFRNYVLFLVCICVKNVLECWAVRLYISHVYLKKSDGKAVLSAEKQKSARHDMIYVALSKVGDLLMFSTDSMVISKVISVTVSGLYSNYYFIFAGLQNMVGLVFDSLMSRMGNQYVRAGNRKKIFGFLYMCCINIVITSISVCGLYWLSDTFITIWMGEDALMEHYVVVLSAAELYLQLARRSIDACRINEGIFREMTFVTILRGVVNVTLSVAAGVWFGLAGIMTVTVLMDLLTVYWYEPFLVMKKYGTKLYLELAYEAVSVLTVFGSLVLTGTAVRGIPYGGIAGFIVKGIVIVAVAVCFSGAVSFGLNRLIRYYENRKSGDKEENK